MCFIAIPGVNNVFLASLNNVVILPHLCRNGGVAKDLEKPLLSPEQMLQLIELMVGEKSPLLHTPRYVEKSPLLHTPRYVV